MVHPAELVQVSKSFPGVHALDRVDLTLRAGTIHALVGENGAGKSTLINVLSGVLHPDAGEVRVAGRPVKFAGARAAHALGIVTVHQEVDLFPDLSATENVGLHQGLPSTLGCIDWARQRRRTAEALAAVGAAVAPGTPADDLTPAQRQLVELAAAVSQAARVLILDEPTSSLSAAESRTLFEHLRRFRQGGAAILYVSHRLDDVFALADEVTVLRDGRRVATLPIVETSPPQLIALMVGRDVPPAPERVSGETGPVRLRCDGLAAADGSFAGVSLEVRGGEVLGLYGLIGAGRSEWAQGLLGLRTLAAGRVEVDGKPVAPRGPGQMVRHGVAYVPEDRLREGLCRGLSVRLNAVLASLGRLGPFGWASRQREADQARAIVEQLSVRLRSVEQPVGSLSGGNQQKVVLGRWLQCEPGVLLLDEPTRGVDVGAKAEIHALVRRLAAGGRAVVLISSELPEVLALADRVGVFRGGRLVTTLDPRTAAPEDVAAAAMPTAREEERDAVTATRRGRRHALARHVRELALAAVVVLFFALLQGWTGDFVNGPNLRAIAADAALLGFCAVAATLVILGGGLDISLGSLMVLSAGVAGRLWEQGAALPLVVAAAVAVGAAGGFLNATLTLLGRVHPIVVTLGMMGVYRGLAQWWLGGNVLIDEPLRRGAHAVVLGVPVLAWLGLALFAGTWAVLTFTVPGRELVAMGSNPAAARRVGISQARVWLTAFTAQGALAGLAGLLYLAHGGALQPTDFEESTLSAIAAAVVGGVAITGGRGSVWGVALGCVFLASLGRVMFLGVSTEQQRALAGALMVGAVLLDTLWRRRAP
jgi:ribose transport system ATP-binding protein/rhamnose transport system ATP-binding protein